MTDSVPEAIPGLAMHIAYVKDWQNWKLNVVDSQAFDGGKVAKTKRQK